MAAKKEWWEEDFALPVLAAFGVGMYLYFREGFEKRAPSAAAAVGPAPAAMQVVSDGTDSMAAGFTPSAPRYVAPPPLAMTTYASSGLPPVEWTPPGLPEMKSEPAPDEIEAETAVAAPAPAPYSCKPEYTLIEIGGNPRCVRMGTRLPSYDPSVSGPAYSGADQINYGPGDRIPDCIPVQAMATVAACPPGQTRSCHRKLIRCGPGQKKVTQGGCTPCRLK